MNHSLEPTPFTVIGGFLGAGKTTLLNRLLANASGQRFAVLVNDFGAINIDADLISAHDGETLKLSNGCICCSMVSGFIETMLRVTAQRDRFDHIIVEASGVSQPERIMDFARLDPELLPASIIVLVDAANLTTRLEDSATGDLVAAQLHSANLVLINKVDLVSDSTLQAAEDTVRRHSPDAVLLRVVQADVPVAIVLEEHPALVEVCSHQSAGMLAEGVSHTHIDQFHTLTLVSNVPVTRKALRLLDESLDSSIIRGKGILQLSGEPGLWSWQRVGTRSRIESLPQCRKQAKDTGPVVEAVLIGTRPVDLANLVLPAGIECPDSIA